MCKHHGVFFCVGIFRIYFSVARIMMTRHIDSFFADGIGNRSIDPMFLCKLYQLYHILKSCFTAKHTRSNMKRLRMHFPAVVRYVPWIHQFHVNHVNDTRCEFRFCHLRYRMDINMNIRNFFRYFRSISEAACIANDNWSATLPYRFPGKRFHRDFRSISKRISHGYANNWFLSLAFSHIHHFIPLSLFSFKTACSACTPSGQR